MENLRGILFMILSMAAFACEDAFIKGAAVSLPAGQILMVIGAAGGTVLACIARARGLRLITPALLSRPVLVRNAAEMIGTIGFVTALTTIALTTTSAILQATPLVITLGAALIFAEPVGWRRWSAIAAGFAGVLIIIRPGLAGFEPNALWAVLGVLGLAGRDLASRAVPKVIPNLQISTWGVWMMVPTGALLLVFSGGIVWPDARTGLLLLGASLFACIAYLTITIATRLGDVSVVTPFRYVRLIFALILGITFFGERPDLLTYCGAALIIASGLFTLLRERRLARLAAQPAPVR